MAVFKFCVRNSAVYLALFPVSFFHKQWGLMKPGLQWACLCPCTSSAWHWFNKARSCLCPSAYPQYIRWHEKAGGTAGSLAKVQLPQLTTSLCCQLGNHPQWWQCDTRVCQQAGTCWTVQAMCGFLPSEAQEGHNFLPLCKLWKDIHCLFLVLTSLKLASNCLVNLWGVIGTFTDQLSLGKGLKIWCSIGVSHLSLLY